MHEFVTTLPKSFLNSFKGRNIIFHLLAIVLTALIVVTNFDWFYYTATRGALLRELSFPAVALGGLVPVAVPLGLFALAYVDKNALYRRTAWVLTQAAILGSVISSIYKAFTGRFPPALVSGATDVSHQFNFGFLRNGIFWGWPSSHTTIAFAMSFALIALYPEKKVMKWLVFLYALYIGLGVSTTIHWFSEFIAGALIGTAIGLAVGHTYRQKAPVAEPAL